jgi:predicted RND superfamily exporter protein
LIARGLGLVPVAVLVMMLVFLVSFRNLLATLLPLPEVAATLLFVFGLMGWLGVSIYLTIALLREQPGVNHVELVKQTAEEMVAPVASTTLTTAIGFMSFAFSPLGPVPAFGIFTAVGVLAVVINFAVMGWLGIPLGVATSKFAGMTLGIGVDFAIHVLEGYGWAQTGRLACAESLGRAMALTGPPVLINTLAVSLGFGGLMLPQVPANARLGLLVVLGLEDWLVAALVILPVLLHWWPLGEDHRSEKAGSAGQK